MNVPTIPAQVLDQAVMMATAQQYFPLSPADRDASGQLCLCAAAVIANAGLKMLRSGETALRFGAELAAQNNKETVFDAFDELGWPAELCASMMTKNDQAPENDRRTVFLDGLHELSAKG